jgi:hypothetical protein
MTTLHRIASHAIECLCILAVGLFGSLLLAGFFGYLNNLFTS